MFLIMSTMTALLECGPIFLGINLGYCPASIIFLCLSYQLGNLFPIPFYPGKKCLIIMALLSPFPLCLASLFCKAPWTQCLFYSIGIMMLSSAMQCVRSMQKGQFSTVLKRLSRVLGFLCSPLMAYVPLLILLMCCLAILFSTKRLPIQVSITFPHSLSLKKKQTNNYYHIMLWHQLHYFIYAYSMIWVCYQKTQNAFLTIVFFSLTWLTYLMAEKFILFLHRLPPLTGNVNSDKLNYTSIVTAGHIFLLLLLVLFPVVHLSWFILLWILTGFGGGTVFAITEICRQSDYYEKNALEFTENIGHFIGTLVAFLWVLFLPQKISCLPYLSAFCVLVVVLLTCKEKIIHSAKEDTR